MNKFKEFVACYLDAWHKYINFSGRATRKDYWGFVLINMLVAFIIRLAEAIVGMDDGFISSLYTLAVICPNITLCTRRLHDVGRSGWWQLAIAVPLLCFYPMYLIWIKAGKPEVNKYGAPVVDEAVYTMPVENEFSAYEMCPTPAAQPAAEPAEELVQPVNRCAACGTKLAENAKFCTECGAPTGK